MKLRDLLENDAEHAQALQKTGFWGKQGAGVVFYAKDTGRLLLALRSESVEQPHTWSTWGGAIDKDEDPEDAAYREATEETDYDGQVHLKHLWTFEHSSGFKYHNYLAIVPKEFDPALNWETDDFQWVKPGDWPKPLHPGFKALLSAAENKLHP